MRNYSETLEKKSKEVTNMQDMATVFQNYYIYIYNYALKLTCHPEDAKDITQETFLKAWKNRETLLHEEAIGKWLRTICYHEFLMKVRTDKKESYLSPEELSILETEGKLLIMPNPLPEEEVVVAEEIKDLQNGCFLAMVRRLSLNQRITFSLVDMFGLPIDTVAEILQISKGATKGLLYRARMNIDSFFADHCNLLYEKNPCSCKAWLEFSGKRTQMQEKTKKLVDHLDYQEKHYTYQESVRSKLGVLYANMPEKKPSEEWYQSVMKLFV